MAKKPKKIKAVKEKKQKYDWPLEKVQFFQSSFTEVKAYFESKYGVYNGHINKSTLGWHDEKIAWKKQIVEERLKKMREKKGEFLGAILDKIGMIVAKEIDEMAENGGVHADDLKKLHEIARTEAGLPVRIIHTKNDNLNYDAGTVRKSLLDKLKKNARPKEPIAGN